MSPTKRKKLDHSFNFKYTVTAAGVPQPYPVPPPNPHILLRLSPAESEDGRTWSVLNICGNREGLEYLAAMLVLSADSAKYDPWFHIHLGDIECVEADLDVTIRAPAYLDILKKRELSESRGTPLPLPERRKRSKKSTAKGERKRKRKP